MEKRDRAAAPAYHERGASRRSVQERPLMFFALAELEHHPIQFDLKYKPGEIDFGEELRQQGELKVEGKAELLAHTLGEVRLRGTVEVELEADCDRCLEPARMRVGGEFDLFYRPAPKFQAHTETQIEEGEVEISFYTGDGIELEGALREFVIVNQPMQRLCTKDCKGLCPNCGVNRNTASCNCAAQAPEKKLAGLKNL